MKAKLLVGALVAAGILGTGAAAYNGHLPAGQAQAQAHGAPATGVAAPAANPLSSSLPLNGFSDLVKTYGPAVVNVSVQGMTRTSAQMPEIPEEFQEFFRGFGGRMPQRGMPQQPTPMRGQGSGFIVSGDGYIMTNAHVVENADQVSVRLTDRREFTAKVVGSDKQSDIALLKIDAKNLPTVKLGDSRKANVGEWVVAIGSPFGFENSVSAGIVSAKARSLPDSSYVPFIQTDVAVNPGNSGGPLFNLAGEVIGINSQIYSRTGSFSGISFAIPVEVAMKVKDQLQKHGKVTRGRLGVTVQDVNAALADSFGLDRARGALVSSVDEKGPAEKAGIQTGDIILRYDGNAIERSADLPMVVADATPGKQAAVEVWRKGSVKTLSVATAEGKNERVAKNDDADAPKGRLGVSVRPLTREERADSAKREGVVVEQVSGAAQRAGVQPGDVVLALNGTRIATPEQLRDAVAKSGKRAALLIQRDERQLFVPVELG